MLIALSWSSCRIFSAEVLLPVIRPGLVNAGIERAKRPAQAVDREGGRDVGSAREPVGAGDGERGDGGRRLRSVDEGEPLLRTERNRRQTGRRERFTPGTKPCIVADPGIAFADEHQRQVGERREVAAGANRAAARDARVDAVVEKVDQPLERRPPDAGETLGKDVGAERHRGANLAHGQRLTDAGGVTAEQVDLQCSKRLSRDRGFGQRAEAGVDAVDRRVAERLAIDDRPRRVDAGDGLGRERDLASPSAIATSCASVRLRPSR